MSEKIACKICGAETHLIQNHLKTDHPEMTLAQYREKFPEAPIMSDKAIAMVEKKRLEQAAAGGSTTMDEGVKVEMAGSAAAVASVTEIRPTSLHGHKIVSTIKKAMHEVFGLGKVKAALNGKGDPIPITVLGAHDYTDLVPDLDENYVFEIDLLKNVILGLELKIPTYCWGHTGTGKTTLFEQVCNRTNRPMLRVQHTVNTEEAHILGQWTVKAGETVFNPGPLALAMRNGWIYCADEYDFALPAVLAAYQPVLEGKPLIIKEAMGTEWGIIHPHPDFRFLATGNTNGCGDETGLYQGTSIQNAANYDRFGMVIEKGYMDKKMESLVVQNQVGLMPPDADKMIEFASLVREAYGGSKISSTISPRTLIFAARIGVKRGSFRQGLALSFVNKLSRIDQEVCNGLAQRVFT